MGGKKIILLVEDEKPLRQVLSLKLTQAGFAVQTAENGREALQVMQQRPADIILLDLVMPEMDGFLVLEELHKSWSGVPVVVLSSLNQAEDIAKAKRLGAADFLIKSEISVAQIIEFIQGLKIS